MNGKLNNIRNIGENAGYATISAIRRVTRFGSRALILIIGGATMAVIGFVMGLIRLEGDR